MHIFRNNDEIIKYKLMSIADEDLRFVTGAEFALERAVHNEKRSPVWWDMFPFVDTFIGVGLLNNKPTLIIRHGSHMLSTYEGMNELEEQYHSPNNGYNLSSEKFKRLWRQYGEEGLEETGSERKTWVVQGEALEKLIKGDISCDEAPDMTALVPMIGSTAIVKAYIEGHKRNIFSTIRVDFDRNLTSSPDPFVTLLSFGGGLKYQIKGCRPYGNIVVVPSNYQNPSFFSNEEYNPKKGSPLALILGTK